MINDNTPENKDLDPVVQAVVNALNDRSKFEPSYVKQNLNETSIADRVKARGEAKAARRDAEKEEKAREWLSQRGITGAEQDAMIKKGVESNDDRLKRGLEFQKKRSMQEEADQVEEVLDDNSLVVDIYEEDGQIVGIDNGVLFIDDELPGIEYVEQFYGSDYIESAINEATQTKGKTKAPAPPPKAKAPAPAPKGKAPAPAPKGKAPVNFMAQQPGANKPAGAVSQNATRTPAGASTTTNTQAKPKPKTKPTTPASRRTDAATKKEDKPSTTASNVTQRARDTKLTTTDLDLSIGDQLKATDKVVDQNIKDASSKLTPGKITKPSLLNRLTGGRFGKGATYTPGDVSAFDDSLKDFGKKVTDAAAKIKLDRDIASKPWETKGSEPGPTDGGKDVLDQLEKDTAAVGGGADAGADEAPATGGGAGDASGRRRVPINFRIAGQAGTVEREAYKKAKDTGEIESQEVTFNVRNPKTNQARTIKPGDAEYDQYLSRYKKMSQAVYEALLRMGAVLTEEGWMLGDELLESVYTEYAPVEMKSSYYYDSTGRLRIMSESEWSTLGLADVILQRLIQEAMDEVGEEDEDVDNDGDSDDSDDYLKNRREKIASKMKEMNEMIRKPFKRLPPKPPMKGGPAIPPKPPMKGGPAIPPKPPVPGKGVGDKIKLGDKLKNIGRGGLIRKSVAGNTSNSSANTSTATAVQKSDNTNPAMSESYKFPWNV